MKIGDTVEIVKYGSLRWISRAEWILLMVAGWVTSEKPKHLLQEDETTFLYDPLPEIVGQRGVIEKIVMVQGKNQYGISGIVRKHAWYNEEQLKVVE